MGHFITCPLGGVFYFVIPSSLEVGAARHAKMQFFLLTLLIIWFVVGSNILCFLHFGLRWGPHPGGNKVPTEFLKMQTLFIEQ